MQTPLKHASWIWDARFPTAENLYLDFWKTVTVDDMAEDYTLHISVDSNYALYVNDRLAAFGQYADYETYKVYDTISLTEYLHPGENQLKFTVLYKGKNSFIYRKGTPGLIFALYAGTTELAVSDETTAVSKNLQYQCGAVENITPQIGASLAYDASVGINPDIQSAVLVDKTMQLYPRPIRKLDVGPDAPVSVCAQGLFRIGEGEGITKGERLFRSYLSARRLGELTGCWRPIKLPLEDGLSFRMGDFCADGIYTVFDLGKESAGIFSLDIELPQEADLEIGYGEHLEDLRPRSYIGTRNFMFSCHLPAGRSTFQIPFLRLGLRYLQLNVHAPVFTLYYAGIRPTDYPLDTTPYFRCGDHLHNRIYETCVRTLKMCMHEHYEDCPWREQALYTMDSRNQMLCGYYTFGEFSFARESLRLISYSLCEDGMLELCSPCHFARTIPSFTAIYPVQLDEYLLYSGDVDFIREMLPTAEAILDMFLHKVDHQTGMIPRWHDDSRYWNFFEWQEGLDYCISPDPEKEIYDAPMNAFVSMALRAMQNMESAVENEDRAAYYRAQKEKLDAKIRQNFWNPDRGVFASYLQENGIDHYAELTNSLIVFADICTSEQQESVLKALANSCLIPVTLSHSIFKYEAMMRDSAAYGKKVLDEIAEKWGEMLFHNATTFYETEDGASAFSDAGSLCHGWSAIPAYLYFAYVLGLKPTAPGYSSYQINRMDCGIVDAHGLAVTPIGMIDLD